jgi:hypothetical protein
MSEQWGGLEKQCEPQPKASRANPQQERGSLPPERTEMFKPWGGLGEERGSLPPERTEMFKPWGGLGEERGSLPPRAN